jgi:hypothetical protein
MILDSPNFTRLVAALQVRIPFLLQIKSSNFFKLASWLAAAQSAAGLQSSLHGKIEKSSSVQLVYEIPE